MRSLNLSYWDKIRFGGCNLRDKEMHKQQPVPVSCLWTAGKRSFSLCYYSRELEMTAMYVILNDLIQILRY